MQGRLKLTREIYEHVRKEWVTEEGKSTERETDERRSWSEGGEMEGTREEEMRGDGDGGWLMGVFLQAGL